MRRASAVRVPVPGRWGGVAVLVMAALVAGCRNDPPPAASSPADREAPPVRETKIPMH